MNPGLWRGRGQRVGVDPHGDFLTGRRAGRSLESADVFDTVDEPACGRVVTLTWDSRIVIGSGGTGILEEHRATCFRVSRSPWARSLELA